MKKVFLIACLLSLFVSCEEKHQDDHDHDHSVDEIFERNAKTVMANLLNWETETIDYSQYADDFVLRGTAQGAPDSISLDDMREMDKEFLALYDFKIATDSINLLPGVDAQTHKPDGSVRHYTDWEIIMPATDSTEARSVVVKMYESFDFNPEGKIIFQQGFGDFGGAMDALEGDDDDDEDEE